MSTHDPIARFHQWFAEASAAGIRYPEQMALATADADGSPSVRMVLLKGVDARGFVFYTNLEGRKARDLAARPRAALCLHWEAQERQVRVEGAVERVSDAEADAYFATRPRGSQLGAWASAQSRPLDDRSALLDRVREAEARFAGTSVSRPPHWGGYRVVPSAVEFWQGRESRLHERDVYAREGDAWTLRMLQP